MLGMGLVVASVVLNGLEQRPANGEHRPHVGNNAQQPPFATAFLHGTPSSSGGGDVPARKDDGGGGGGGDDGDPLGDVEEAAFQAEAEWAEAESESRPLLSSSHTQRRAKA